MDSSLILADLREQFGAKKAVLYAEELAIALDRTISAVYTLNSRGTLPVPCIKVGGRLAVSIYEVADWLAGNAPKAGRSKPSIQAQALIPEPKRPRESMRDYLMQVHAQRRFLAELEVAIQHQLEQEDATAVYTASQAVFDDQPDLFFVDTDGLVLAYGRDEEVAPSSNEDSLQWLTWISALVKPWSNENTRLNWLTKAERVNPGFAALVEADRRAFLNRI